MSPNPSRVVYRVGDFLFEPATGEVRPALDPSGSTDRLPPQPARLLEILIERNGGLVSREEIRAALWPDSHVDFDQGLRFCVSQIRSALGDSGREPTYIETLPRRGYRLMRPVEAVRETKVATLDAPKDSPGPPARWRPAGWQTVVGLLVVLLAVGPVLARGCGSSGTHGPIRLAIMPFELAADGGDSADLARLSEWLLAELSGGWGGRLEVIGPRSTAPYSSFPFPEMDRMAAELPVDFVLNARFIDREGELQLLVELIDLDDRSHPWAEYFRDTRSWEEIGRQVRDEVTGALGLPPADRTTALE